jgi:multiple sugar transport system ATP-binding protein
MDEPLSNLDAKLRVQTRTQIALLQRRLAITTVYVTHDQVEAMRTGDRVAVLKDGLLMQVGTPQELYDQPQNSFVAGFIGSPAMNLLNLMLVDGGAALANVTVPLDRETMTAAAALGVSKVLVGFRPEDLRLTDSVTGWPIKINLVASLGADAYVYGTASLADGTEQDVIVRTDGRNPPKRDETVHLTVVPGHMHVFDPESGARIGH